MFNFISVERSRKGFPCLWEFGGGYSNTGDSTIIADKNGEAKTAIYIRRRGQLANGYHALIPVVVGDFIIEADHHRGDFHIRVWKITEITPKDKATTELVAEFFDGEWDNLPQFLEEAVEAAKAKATCYHCREPYFAKEPVPRN